MVTLAAYPINARAGPGAVVHLGRASSVLLWPSAMLAYLIPHLPIFHYDFPVQSIEAGKRPFLRGLQRSTLHQIRASRNVSASDKHRLSLRRHHQREKSRPVRIIRLTPHVAGLLQIQVICTPPQINFFASARWLSALQIAC